MYQGNNPTALRSKEWLAESLIKLMGGKKYDAITIKDIYMGADLSRQTFYNLFDGKEDVLRYYLSTLYLPVLRRMERQETPTFEDVTEQLACVLEENKCFISVMVENHLESIIVEGTNQVVDSLSDRLFHLKTDTPAALYKRALVSGGIVNAVLYWIRDGMPITAEELNKMIQDYLSRIYAVSPQTTPNPWNDFLGGS